MTSAVTNTQPTRGPRTRPFLYVLILLAASGGIYAGTRWHSTFAPMLGMRQEAGAADGSEPAKPGAAKQLWTCGMHPQVIQDKPGDCPICHMKLTPLKVDAPVVNGGQPAPSAAGTVLAPAAGRKVKYWWDPMLNPPYISDKPGKSPMGMDLIPVYENEALAAGMASTPGAVTIDPAVVQNMGVRTATVTEAPLKRSVRLVGYLDEAQPNIHDINLRVSGWVRRLYANTEGQHVVAGDPLFDLYSPDLQVAVEELIAARRSRAGAQPDQIAGQTAADLYDAATKKLELLGLDPRQIEALAKLDRAPDTITFASPVTGDITEKPIVEGAAVRSGDRALRIVDRSTLWLDAQVFEKDLSFVRVGQQATATVASGPGAAGQPLRGEVVFVHPRVDAMTRTTTVRLAVANPELGLRPGMYATVRLQSELADRAIMVPREAIIDSGEKQVAFVVEGAGRFQPRQVRMGPAGEDGMVQVVGGLSPGEMVVTSGQFLLDSESRLREAIQKYLSQSTAATGQAAPSAVPTNAAPASTSTVPAASPAERADVSPASPQQQQKVDAVASEYLKLSSALGTVQKKDTPPPQLDMAPLVSAAHALHGSLSGTKRERLAVELAKAAEAMKGQTLDKQRELFSALGEKVIALVDAMPPGAEVAETLYVMHCPMAPGGGKGDWLQTSSDVANPFFATDMKECGLLVRTIKARDGGNK